MEQYIKSNKAKSVKEVATDLNCMTEENCRRLINLLKQDSISLADFAEIKRLSCN